MDVVYACFKSNNSLVYEYCLLGFGPYEDEAKLGSLQIYEYISFTLSFYGKKCSDVTCLVGYNYRVNKATADMANFNLWDVLVTASISQ